MSFRDNFLKSKSGQSEAISVVRIEMLRRKITCSRLKAEMGVSDSTMHQFLSRPHLCRKAARKAELLLGVAIVTPPDLWEVANRIASRIHLDPLSMSRPELRRLACRLGIRASAMNKQTVIAALDQYFQANPIKKHP